MVAPSVTPQVIPTGGAISLSISGAVSGAATLSRAVSGGSFTQIYSGGITPFYLDVGDGLPAPLDQTKFYQYQYTDGGGTTTTAFIQPVATLNINREPFTAILIRLLQAGVSALTIPNGIKAAQVMHAMPLMGLPPLPFVVVNLDLMQQDAIPIGQSLPLVDSDTQQTITGFVSRTYRISVLAENSQTRDFYRDNIAGMLNVIYGPVLQPLGVDVTHRFQITSGQVADDRKAQMPGFYYADIMLDFIGTLDVVMSASSLYGLIERIDFTASDDGNDTFVTVPLA